jgi:transposase-like protein
MESVRWPGGPVCPRCGTINNAKPIRSRPGLYRCGGCGKQFTVTVGTALEGSHLPLRVWYLAMYLMLSTAKPISAMSLSRQLGIQYRTCWHLLHRLRAMLAGGETLPLAGVIEADETYVGGKATNRQKHRDKPTRGRGTDKPMLFAAIERGGEARAAVVPSASAVALDPLMFGWFDRNSVLCTDELAVYDWFGRKMRKHYRVNHARGEYARTQGSVRVHVNSAEGFFGLFKRGVFGIHHHVSAKHLHRYAAEHQFRYNGRGHDAGERIARCLIGQHGRLRLKELLA